MPPVPVSQLRSLDAAGFKIVPLGEDSQKPAMPWTQIYLDGGWPDKAALEAKAGLFSNVATCFGPTMKANACGAPLFLNCLDVDSVEVFRILENLVDTDGVRHYSFFEWAKKYTWVTKTKKKFGFHVYWLTASANKPIRTEMCRPGYEFEIKTDKTSGLAHLPPSAHRNDLSWHYQNVGMPHVAFQPTWYKIFAKKLLKDCLLPAKPNAKKLLSSLPEPDGKIVLDSAGIERLVHAILDDYRAGARNVIVMYLAGYLHRRYVALDTAREVVTRLAKAAGDEELRGRLATVEVTYKKQRHIVKGFEGLKDLFSQSTMKKLADLGSDSSTR